MYNNKIEERYIAWIDIMGFSEFVSNIDDDRLQNFYLFLKNFKNEHNGFYEATPREKGKTITFSPCSSIVSDTIVLSLPTSKLELVWDSTITKFLSILFYNLLVEYNLCIRGAIVKGKCIHGDIGIVGKPVIEAHKIESKLCNMPRIIVSNTPEITLKFHPNPENTLFCEKKFQQYQNHRKDYDGLIILDIFREMIILSDGDKNKVDIEKLKNVINEKLNSNNDKEKQCGNYLANSFNHTIEYLKYAKKCAQDEGKNSCGIENFRVDKLNIPKKIEFDSLYKSK